MAAAEAVADDTSAVLAETPAPAPAAAAAAAAAATGASARKKQTAAQRRQATARETADAVEQEALADVESLVRNFANDGVLLPLSRLPALYAEEYGRHRPLSLPNWRRSLARLETCRVLACDTAGEGEGAAEQAVEQAGWVVWVGEAGS